MTEQMCDKNNKTLLIAILACLKYRNALIKLIEIIVLNRMLMLLTIFTHTAIILHTLKGDISILLGNGVPEKGQYRIHKLLIAIKFNMIIYYLCLHLFNLLFVECNVWAQIAQQINVSDVCFYTAFTRAVSGEGKSGLRS